MNGVVGSTLFCLIGGLLLVVVIAVFNMIRVVPEYQRLVVFRLGRVLDKPKGPGLVFLIPGVDRPVKVEISLMGAPAASLPPTTPRGG